MGIKTTFPRYMYICTTTDRIWWCALFVPLSSCGINISDTRSRKNITAGNVDPSDLIMIMKWVTNTSSRSPNDERISWAHATSCTAKNIIKETARNEYNLDTLTTENPNKHFYSSGSFTVCIQYLFAINDDVIKREHFPRYWPFVRGIHRSSVNSPHKGQ